MTSDTTGNESVRAECSGDSAAGWIFSSYFYNLTIKDTEEMIRRKPRLPLIGKQLLAAILHII